MVSALMTVWGTIGRLYVNYFQPVMKMVSQTRHSAKVHKVYDTTRTPYQRLLDSGILTEARRQELAATYHGLNPVFLLTQNNENLETLCQLGNTLVRNEEKSELARLR